MTVDVARTAHRQAELVFRSIAPERTKNDHRGPQRRPLRDIDVRNQRETQYRRQTAAILTGRPGARTDGAGLANVRIKLPNLDMRFLLQAVGIDRNPDAVLSTSASSTASQRTTVNLSLDEATIVLVPPDLPTVHGEPSSH